MSMPPAKTAMVPPDSAASCAAESMPRARPETITKSASPRPLARSAAIFRPATEALRAPTMAIAGEVEMADIAAHGKERRRGVGVAQPGRIERLAEADEARAEPIEGGDLGLGLRKAGGADIPRCAAASRQVRQRVERGLRRAEMVDQVAESGRTDILAADQPEPGRRCSAEG